MDMELFYVVTDRGCGIRNARDEDAAWFQLEREVGVNNVREVRPATADDIAYVEAMGGYVPKHPAPAAEKATSKDEGERMNYE